MTDTDIEQMIQAQLTDPSFETWNTTTVNQLMTVATGVRGAGARDKALRLLEEFSAWRKTQPATYTPTTGVEPMFSTDHIVKEFAWLRAFQPPEDKHQISIAAQAFRLGVLHANQSARDAKIGFAVFTGFVAIVGALIAGHVGGSR